MDTMKLTIGGVYTHPDLELLRQVLIDCGLRVVEVEFGRTIVEGIETDIDFPLIEEELEKHGFVLINDKNQWLSELIKIAIHKRLGYTHDSKEAHLNFSDIVASELGRDYRYLSTVFSKVEGITIEKYIIEQRIEMASKMLRCKKLTLEEIAHRLEYSSVSYFSNQFKKIKGCSPSQYRKMLYADQTIDEECQLAS